jgi:hypothetical protein
VRLSTEDTTVVTHMNCDPLTQPSEGVALVQLPSFSTASSFFFVSMAFGLCLIFFLDHLHAKPVCASSSRSSPRVAITDLPTAPLALPDQRTLPAVSMAVAALPLICPDRLANFKGWLAFRKAQWRAQRARRTQVWGSRGCGF